VRLLYVSNIPSPHQLELFESIARRQLAEVKALFCMWSYPGRGWARPRLTEGFEILPHISAQWLLPDLSFAFDIDRRIRDFRPDVAIVGSYMVPGLHGAMSILSRRRIPWLYWEEYHRFSANPVKRAIRKRLLHGALRGCDAVLAIGARAREFFQRIVGDAREVHDFPYASDLGRFARAERKAGAGGPRFLYSGQLIERKGVDVLLDGFARVAAAHGGAQLVILGDGPLRSRLEASVPDEFRERVHFLGNVPWADLPGHYAEADVFVFPSRHDGWGLVVPEAMAAGLPVISTLHVGSALDLVKEGQTGFLVQKDHARALAERMSYFCDRPEEAARMGERAREEAMRLDVREAGPRLVELASRYRRPERSVAPNALDRPGLPRCPVCGGRRVLLSQDPVRRLFRCRSCRSIERLPKGDTRMSDVRRSIYDGGNLLRRRTLQPPRRERQVFKRRRDLLMRVSRPRVLCEVGPGDGGFARSILSDVNRLLLVEESRVFADHIRATLPDDVTVLTGNFMHMEMPETCDALVAFQVLEHVDDPKSFLKRCFSQLGPGGVVVFETPSASSLECRLFRSRWNMAGIFDHRHLLGREGVYRLAESVGAEVCRLENAEPWWEWISSAVFAGLDAWKDFLHGRGRWTNRLSAAACPLPPVCRPGRHRQSQAGSMGHKPRALVEHRGHVLRRVMSELVDAMRPGLAPMCRKVEELSMGSHWLVALRRASSDKMAWPISTHAVSGGRR